MNEVTHVVHPFAPVADENSRILILGSFPSVKSRELRFYYGHPRNRFWPMLAALYGEPIPEKIEDKRALILRHHLALWDVIGECDITGSSDASVRNAVPVEISRVTSVAKIRRVLCNGALAGRFYQRYLQERMGMEAMTLPSTSPANAAWSMKKLTEVWGEAIAEGAKEDVRAASGR